jgi:hypothetical protein
VLLSAGTPKISHPRKGDLIFSVSGSVCLSAGFTLGDYGDVRGRVTEHA